MEFGIDLSEQTWALGFWVSFPSVCGPLRLSVPCTPTVDYLPYTDSSHLSSQQRHLGCLDTFGTQIHFFVHL